MRFIVIAILLSMLSACTDESTPMIVVTLDSDLSIPEVLHEIELSIVASRTESGATCEPLSESFFIENSSDLPLEVAISPGVVYSEFVVYRVSASLELSPLAEEPQVFYRQSLMRWPSEGKYTQIVMIEPEDCDPDCPSFEQCVESQCLTISEPMIFENTAIRDIGVPCLLE